MNQPSSKLWKEIKIDILPTTTRPGLTKKADTCEQCGIWPFTTGLDDPFLTVCKWHDSMYAQKEQGTLPPDWDNRHHVDCNFFSSLAITCHTEKDYEKRAKLYQRMAYYIITVNELGGLFW